MKDLKELGGNEPLAKLISLMHQKIAEDEQQIETDIPSPLVGLDLHLGPREDV